MKTTVRALSLFLVAVAAASADEADRLIERLNSPDFETRIRATTEMGDFISAEFQRAAKSISKADPVPSDWPAVNEAIKRRAEADGISALRKAITEIGGETEHRFQSLEALQDSAIRKAALSAGLEAPGDFESGLIADTIATAPEPIRFDPLPPPPFGVAALGRR